MDTGQVGAAVAATTGKVKLYGLAIDKIEHTGKIEVTGALDELKDRISDIAARRREAETSEQSD
jgi:hypothetical protein